MVRTITVKSNGLVGWERLAYLGVFIAVVTFDSIIVHYEGKQGRGFANGGWGPVFRIAPAYAISPDQNIGKNHLHQYHTGTSFNTHHNDDQNCEKKIVDTRNFNYSKRRLSIEKIQSATKSFGNKVVESNFCFSRIFDNSPLRKFNLQKKKNQARLRETTRLVGGGTNENIERKEDPQQNESSLSYNPSASNVSDDGKGEKSFLGNILPKTQQLFLSKGSELGIRRNFRQMLAFLHKTTSQAGPSLLTALSLFGNRPNKNEVSVLTLYMVALLGASCGFHLFLHFITLGFALGVTLPLIVALFFYQKHFELPLPTVLHSSITILWGIRLFSFLAIREYFTWPALHQKVVEVQAKMNIPFASKILCWFVYSFFYVTLVASCWSRLLQSSSPSPSNWGVLGFVGLSLQIVGLSLETIADLQKNSFKSRNRHSWCNVGVWRHSTHPNYLGEGVFWWGTYLAHGFHSPLPSALATIGLVLILYVLKGSAKSLSSKQKEKYGQEIDFYQFQRTHNVFGPKHMWSRQKVEAVVATPMNETITNNDIEVSVSNNGNIQEINQ
mmetsp:Transcript_13722/g.27718  ORF Transcript_13722/g.27718 Transcript_13722/m.27718 type:complete len:555 (-) Transcript_13722:358-2022(-)